MLRQTCHAGAESAQTASSQARSILEAPIDFPAQRIRRVNLKMLCARCDAIEPRPEREDRLGPALWQPRVSDYMLLPRLSLISLENCHFLAVVDTAWWSCAVRLSVAGVPAW